MDSLEIPLTEEDNIPFASIINEKENATNIGNYYVLMQPSWSNFIINTNSLPPDIPYHTYKTIYQHNNQYYNHQNKPQDIIIVADNEKGSIKELYGELYFKINYTYIQGSAYMSQVFLLLTLLGAPIGLLLEYFPNDLPPNITSEISTFSTKTNVEEKIFLCMPGEDPEVETYMPLSTLLETPFLGYLKPESEIPLDTAGYYAVMGETSLLPELTGGIIINENGTYDVTKNSEVIINVPSKLLKASKYYITSANFPESTTFDLKFTTLNGAKWTGIKKQSEFMDGIEVSFRDTEGNWQQATSLGHWYGDSFGDVYSSYGYGGVTFILPDQVVQQEMIEFLNANILLSENVTQYKNLFFLEFAPYIYPDNINTWAEYCSSEQSSVLEAYVEADTKQISVKIDGT